MKFIQFFLAAMVAVVLAAISLSAFAAMQYKSGDGVMVRLLDDPCPALELAFALALYGQSKLAAVTIDGNQAGACWVQVGDKILLADVLGNSGYILAADFKSAD